MGNEKKNRNEEIKIDYENIDTEDIMGQIRKKIAGQPRKLELEQPVPPEYSASPAPIPPQTEESSGRKAKIKNLTLKLMRPFSPLIKFMVLPVHQELRDTIQNLYKTNQRLDLLERRTDENFSKVHEKLDQIDQATIKRMEELNRVREYTKLLHSLSHNIVVELTKLKIEEERLKITTRILEKDFEFLGRREKALERKVFE
jgi:hypothetical protein